VDARVGDTRADGEGECSVNEPSREKYRTRLKEIARRLGPLTALSGSSRHGTWSAEQSAELARRLVEVVTLLDEALADPDVGSLP
jgi:hypothetical protein